uniref:Uncharacterized protein n=1 Tax=Glossina brevipalpis TaxID=37001 RepID=A0A1A9WEP4_9MUSC
MTLTTIRAYKDSEFSRRFPLRRRVVFLLAFNLVCFAFHELRFKERDVKNRVLKYCETHKCVGICNFPSTAYYTPENTYANKIYGPAVAACCLLSYAIVLLTVANSVLSMQGILPYSSLRFGTYRSTGHQVTRQKVGMII